MAVSCLRPAPSFAMLLARIDADPELVDPAPFLGAARLADDSLSRLRLMKRAYARDPKLAALVSDAVLAGPGESEAVSLAAFSAYMDSGRAADALSLFDRFLEPRDHPDLFAEAYVSCRVSGLNPSAGFDELVAAADGIGRPELFVEAAVSAMAEGNAQAASIILTEALKAGAAPDARLLWDAGAYGAIAESMPRSEAPADLHIAADSAWLTGNGAQASALYLEIIELFPAYSWKPYAALSRLAWADAPEDAADPVGPFSPGWPRAGGADGTRSGGDQPGYWIALMASRFPGNADAAREQAAFWIRNGMPDRASAILASGGASDEATAIADIAAYAASYPDAAAPRALEVAAAYPDSAAVQEAALSCLFSLGAWRQFAGVFGALRVEPPRAWFWRSVGLALGGDAPAAAETIRTQGAGGDRWATPFDLGVMELAAGRYREAALAFVTAAGERDGMGSVAEDRARAYGLAGDAWRLAGDKAAARDAYRAALTAVPSSQGPRAGLELLGDD